jgi:hypothetical protein
MRPRFFSTSQQELGSACDTLRRATTRPEPKDRGPLIAVCFFLGLLVWCLGFGWNQIIAHATPTSHLYDEKLIAKTQAWHNWLEARHLAYLPDWRLVPYRDVGSVSDARDLPKTGNHIGDRYGISGAQFHYVWIVPLGETQPRWIDP